MTDGVPGQDTEVCLTGSFVSGGEVRNTHVLVRGAGTVLDAKLAHHRLA